MSTSTQNACFCTTAVSFTPPLTFSYTAKSSLGNAPSSLQPLAVMSCLVDSYIVLRLGPTWLTERFALEHSHRLSASSFSQLNSWPSALKPTTPSCFISRNCALPGSHLLLHVVPNVWKNSRPPIAMPNIPTIQFSRPSMSPGVYHESTNSSPFIGEVPAEGRGWGRPEAASPVRIKLPRHEGMRCS